MYHDDGARGDYRNDPGRTSTFRSSARGPGAISPGKRSLTATLPARASSVAQRKPVTERPARAAAPAAADWTDVVFRPDLFGAPTTAPIQRKSNAAPASGGTSASSSGGRAMPADVQAKMERSFGRDFSATRIHEGAHAAELGAVAYAQGTDIHFAPGHYDPHSLRGQELLGHELAHVVQQSQGRVQSTVQMKGQGVNTDPSLEREADEMGARAARGQSASGAATAGAEPVRGTRASSGPGVAQRMEGASAAAVGVLVALFMVVLTILWRYFSGGPRQSNTLTLPNVMLPPRGSSDRRATPAGSSSTSGGDEDRGRLEEGAQTLSNELSQEKKQEAGEELARSGGNKEQAAKKLAKDSEIINIAKSKSPPPRRDEGKGKGPAIEPAPEKEESSTSLATTVAGDKSEISDKNQLGAILYHRLEELRRWRSACVILQNNGKDPKTIIRRIDELVTTYESIGTYLGSMELANLIAWFKDKGSEKHWLLLSQTGGRRSESLGERLVRESHKTAHEKAVSRKEQEREEEEREEKERKDQSKASRRKKHERQVVEDQKKRKEKEEARKRRRAEKEEELEYQENEAAEFTTLDKGASPEDALPAQARVIFASMRSSELNDESVNKANVTVFVDGSLRTTFLETYASGDPTKTGNEEWESNGSGDREDSHSKHDSEVNLLGDMWQLLSGQTEPGNEVTVQVVSYFGACNGCKGRLDKFADKVREELEVELTLVYYYFEYRKNTKRIDLDTKYGWDGDGSERVQVGDYEHRELHVHQQ